MYQDKPKIARDYSAPMGANVGQVATKESRMQADINALVNLISSLENKCLDLEIKLKPVLFEEPNKIAESLGESPMPSGYCDQIESQLSRLEMLKQRMGSLTERLEV